MAFYLYQHNHLEELARQYLALRREGVQQDNRTVAAYLPRDPMTAETVVVQTYGMRIWLNQFAAQAGEVMANVNFLYMNNFIQEELQRHIPAGANYQPALFTNEVMTWRILKLMKEEHPCCEELRGYLSQQDDEQDLRSYELALRIAAVFDQYQVYLPDKLVDWREPSKRPTGAPGSWQAAIWQELQRYRHRSVFTMADALVTFLKSGTVLPRNPVTVFGIGAMPPLFFKVIRHLAEATDIHFFYQNPCGEYWADHSIFKFRREAADVAEQEDMNPLIGAFGLQGREFFQEIMEAEDVWEMPQTSPVFPKNLLGSLQQDIFKRRGIEQDEEKRMVSSKDDSVTFHDCHTPFRQIEILQDQLLKLFQQNQGEHRLYPDDILVMAPDMNHFVPAIEAVFGIGPLKEHYALSDRSLRKNNSTAEAFLAILDLAGSLFERSKIQVLLESRALRARYHFDDFAVKKLRRWIYDSYVCWGIDGQHHQTQEQGDRGFDAYSWRHALNRMLFGIAVEDPEPPNADWSPKDLAFPELPPLNLANSQEDRELLGNFSALIEALIETSEKMQKPHTLAEWQAILMNILTDFFAPDNETAQDYASIHDSIRRMANNGEMADFRQEISFSVVRKILSDAAESPMRTYPFLSGKITFCSLQPMRSVPRRVIVLLGMDEGKFPRIDNPAGFNLIPKSGLRGIRSRQWEDRYLFMEAILAAQEHLLIFYRGQSEQRQKNHPPALPVCELRDYIGKHFLAENGSKLPDGLIIRHSLHPYLPECYGEIDAPHFSFNPYYFALAQAIARQTKLPEFKPFAAEIPPGGFPLSSPINRLDIRAFTDFFTDASGGFLIHALRFPKATWTSKAHTDIEPLTLNKQEKKRIRGKLSYLKDPDSEECHLALQKWLQAKCELPSGEVGRQEFLHLLQTGWMPAENLRSAWQGQKQIFRSLELSVEGVPLVLEGYVEMDPGTNTMVECFFQEPGANNVLSHRQLIKAWIRWLFATATSPDERPVTCIIALDALKGDKNRTFPPCTREHAIGLLLDLATGFLAGIRRPLCLFSPETLSSIKSVKEEDVTKTFQENLTNNPSFRFLFGSCCPADIIHGFITQTNDLFKEIPL